MSNEKMIWAFREWQCNGNDDISLEHVFNSGYQAALEQSEKLAQQSSVVGAIHIKNTEKRIAECSKDDRINTVQISVAKFYSMLCEIDELRAELAQQSEPVQVSHPVVMEKGIK